MNSISKAIQESLAQAEAEDKKFKFLDYDGFLKVLDAQNISSLWTVLKKETITMFLMITHENAPFIKCSVTVNDKLDTSIFFGSTELTAYEDNILPVTINDFRHLLKILDYVEAMSTGREPNYGVSVSQLIGELLDNLKNYFPENENSIDFLAEQVKLISFDKAKRRYSPELTVFSVLLHSISSHGYNFIKGSGNVILPHPKNIQNICAKTNISPHNEQFDTNFLMYAKGMFSNLNSHEKIVILMVDEIHLKQYFDYKGGNIVGMAFNENIAASSAHVFMISSLLSPYKDVVHILPVKAIQAEILHAIIKKIIIGLENIGYFVIAVVTDNHSVNRKAMSFFAKNKSINIVYPHPVSEDRPLFFVTDSVHVLKCIRNNWLNQKNAGKCMFYPDFDAIHDIDIKTASFDTLRKLYEIESNNLLTYNYTLTFKALHPSSFERQNVKLVLKIFNDLVANSLRELGPKYNLQFYKDTANYIEIIRKWWDVVNVKTPYKGVHKRNDLMKPITSLDDENAVFLNSILNWLDIWEGSGSDTGILTKETHSAFTQTTHALIEMARYCIEDLNFKYFLCGKIQTDPLEDRFSKYRYLAGSQYNVSLRQIFESESKLRLQNYLPLSLHSKKIGVIPIEKLDVPPWDEMQEITLEKDLNLSLSELDLESDDSIMPIITFISGYCIYVVCKHLKCTDCHGFLTIDKQLVCEDSLYSLIASADRGALKYPMLEIVIIVHYCYNLIKKILSSDLEKEFLQIVNQRLYIVNLAFKQLNDTEVFHSIVACNVHDSDIIKRKILFSTTNILLNNYVKKKE